MGNLFTIEDEKESEVIQDQDMPLPPDLKMETSTPIFIEPAPLPVKKTTRKNKTIKKHKNHRSKQTLKNRD
jgi:hypothetical protein